MDQEVVDALFGMIIPSDEQQRLFWFAHQIAGKHELENFPEIGHGFWSIAAAEIPGDATSDDVYYATMRCLRWVNVQIDRMKQAQTRGLLSVGG